MIFPFPENFKGPSQSPVAWMLIGLNVFIFIAFFLVPDPTPDREIYSGSSLKAAGRLYLQYLDERGAIESAPSWVREARSGVGDSMEFLGALAYRDSRFGEFLKRNDLRGDPVQIAALRKVYEAHRRKMEKSPLFQFGLNSLQRDGFAWITYQFSHASLLHLLSNLMFLLLLGFAVETAVGGFALLLIYLCGGIAGGLFFLAASPYGVVPMVGASGAVSALLAFYCFFEARRRIRYICVLLPLMGQNAFIYMPTLLIVPMFLVGDLASVLSAPEGLASGVAYTAHLGGALFGILLAMVLRHVPGLRPQAG